MDSRKLPSQEALRQLFRYEPETGKLFWKERGPELFSGGETRSPEYVCSRWNSRHAGKEAFTTEMPDGHMKGTIHSVYYLAHRIIWKMMAGEDPDEIDHINGNPSDNRWENLRNVGRSENMKNARIPKHNTSGIMGIARTVNRQKWTAQIRTNGKNIYLGHFDCIANAIRARKEAEREYGFHENHGRQK